MIRRLLLAIAAMLAAVPARAQGPPPPRLIVVISVDQLSTALFEEYFPQFSGGFAELASGTVFRKGSSSAGTGTALGDSIKAQWPSARDVAVSGEKVVALPMSGARADQRWYWAGNRFETNVAGAKVPQVVAKVNAAIASALAQPRAALEPTPFCLSRAAAQGRSGQLQRAAGDTGAFAASPELDGDTLALAAGLVDEMRLGRGASPDLLSIELEATANVERAYGRDSEQMCLQLTELDREIADFLSLLDSRGIDYAVALMGRNDGPVPILFWRSGFKGATLDTPAAPDDVERTIAALIGLPASPGPSDGHCLEGTPAFCH